MILKEKTVRDALKGTGWDKLEMTDESFHEFLRRYGDYTCKFPAKIKHHVTYYALYKKWSQGSHFRIFQKGKTLDFASMDPFENALCLVCEHNCNPYRVTIFEYAQEPFFETIYLTHTLTLLFMHFEDYAIFDMDGRILDVEKKDDLLFWDKGLVAISKKAFQFQGPFQDHSEDISFHIVMRYLPPTAQSILANRKQ